MPKAKISSHTLAKYVEFVFKINNNIILVTVRISCLLYCTSMFQKWENDDYRLARFMHAPKQVNEQWAAKLIAAVPPKEVDKRVVWCDGGSGPEGHPRVYINLVIHYSAVA